MSGWWLRLARYARPHGMGLTVVVLLMLVGVSLELLAPWPLKLIVDYVLTGEPLPGAAGWLTGLPAGSAASGQLAWLAVGVVLIFLASRGAYLLQSYLQAGIGSRMVYRLGGDVFEHLQRLSLNFHARARAGDLVRRVTIDSLCVRELIVGVFIPLLTSLTSLIAMVVVMWHLHRALTLVAMLAALPLGILIKITAARMTQRSYEQQEHEGQMMALAEQTLNSLPVVQAFTREEHEDERFRSLSTQTIRAYLRVVAAQMEFQIGVNAATALGTAMIMGTGGFYVLEGSLSVGSLLVFLAYLVALYSPMESLALLSSSVASAAARARRISEILDTEERVRERAGARPLAVRSTDGGVAVSLEGVTFGYERGRPILQGVTLQVQPGETVALVGRTGAGKSTLVALIPRFFDPWEGRVTVAGVDVREVQLASLRAQVALVLQEPFLLPLSVAENIAYGRPQASREEIETAARAANADEFIRRLPAGYETVLGERGVTLSGGEKQRLAIARAVLKDAPILILDEPTSALDGGTEALVLEALEQLRRDRTTFIIAHRLSTVRQADKIVVLDQGKVIESGTHGELMTSDGYYRRVSQMLSITV